MEMDAVEARSRGPMCCFVCEEKDHRARDWFLGYGSTENKSVELYEKIEVNCIRTQSPDTQRGKAPREVGGKVISPELLCFVIFFNVGESIHCFARFILSCLIIRLGITDLAYDLLSPLSVSKASFMVFIQNGMLTRRRSVKIFNALFNPSDFLPDVLSWLSAL
jgi:hypothetical protein